MTARLPAAERRQQLLDVALEVFSREGYHQASMNDIAEAAGVTKPVLYQHFGSKRELFAELLREVGDRMAVAIGKATAEATGPREQVIDGMRAYFEWVDSHRSGFEILFSGETRRDPEFLKQASRVEKDMAAAVGSLIVVDGLDPERQLLLGQAIVGMAEATCRHWLASGKDLAPDELAEQVAELAWKGLRGLRPAG